MGKRTRKMSGGAAKHDLEIKSEKDVSKLDEILDSAKKNGLPKIFVIYIGAEEWCGPCQRYRPTWDEYKNTPGRQIPMIHVDHKAKDKSKYMSKVKIDGFPTNGVYSAEDESFEAIPDIHNKDAMTKLLKTEPSKLMKSKSANNENSDYTDSLVPTPTTRAKMIQSGRRALKNRYTPVPDMNAPLPPNTNSDTVERTNAVKGSVARPAKGGSLFQTLVRAVKGLGHSTRRAKRKGSRTLKN